MCFSSTRTFPCMQVAVFCPPPGQVIAAGPAEEVARAMEAAEPFKAALQERGVLVVPFASGALPTPLRPREFCRATYVPFPPLDVIIARHTCAHVLPRQHMRAILWPRQQPSRTAQFAARTAALDCIGVRGTLAVTEM